MWASSEMGPTSTQIAYTMTGASESICRYTLAFLLLLAVLWSLLCTSMKVFHQYDSQCLAMCRSKTGSCMSSLRSWPLRPGEPRADYLRASTSLSTASPFLLIWCAEHSMLSLGVNNSVFPVQSTPVSLLYSFAHQCVIANLC